MSEKMYVLTEKQIHRARETAGEPFVEFLATLPTVAHGVPSVEELAKAHWETIAEKPWSQVPEYGKKSLLAESARYIKALTSLTLLTSRHAPSDDVSLTASKPSAGVAQVGWTWTSLGDRHFRAGIDKPDFGSLTDLVTDLVPVYVHSSTAQSEVEHG